MCGIVGYAGEKHCKDILIQGLLKLEYRGYDSAGVSLFEEGEIKTIKAKGKISSGLIPMLKNDNFLAKTGIGHTRWATHGEPSDINSHPIGNSRVSIVHNGIIENYRELKSFLTKKNYTFESETDTETVAKLLDYFYNGNPLQTIQKVVNIIKGAYALGIIFSDKPDKIYAARKESPLIIGKGKGETFIASDIAAILEYTREYYLLERHEIAEISSEGAVFYDVQLQPLEKKSEIADWSVESAQKGGYEHFMLKEIYEQPEVIKNTLSPRIKGGMPDFSECSLSDTMLSNYKHVFIIGCGSAMHAGVVGKYLIEELARTPVVVDIASEFRYRHPLICEDDLVIIISQSGETADSLAALRLANKVGADTLALVNVVGSSIAREAGMVLYTMAGPEISVCSTKAYTVQCALMYLFAFRIAFARNKISEEYCKKLVKELLLVPEALEKSLARTNQYQVVASRLMSAESLLYIGRGLDYALSMEGSLKLKEISYIHSESYAAGELKHGTISLITDTMPVIAVITQRDLFEKTFSNIKTVKSRGAIVVIICHDTTEIETENIEYLIKVPSMRDILMPLVAVVPLQLIAYYTAVLRGCDVDKPRNLAKSVTVE